MQPNCLDDNSALTQSGHAAGWGSHSPTCDPNLLAVILAVYGFSGEKTADSNLPTHTFGPCLEGGGQSADDGLAGGEGALTRRLSVFRWVGFRCTDRACSALGRW